MVYTQYPIIRNSLIRNSTEFLGKFKKRALGRSNLRNASKNLRNGHCLNKRERSLHSERTSILRHEAILN